MRIAAVLCVVAALMGQASAATDPAAQETLPAPADNPVAALFRDGHVFGTFARDCGRPPTPANPHVTVSEMEGGHVVETHDLGAAYAANRYSVLSARRADHDEIEVSVIFMTETGAEQPQTLLWRLGDGTRRTMFNRVDGGAVMVRNGVATANGKRTPVLRKCG